MASADTTPKQNDPLATATRDSEPLPDFDARRFSVELTLLEGAAIWPELFEPDTARQPLASADERIDFPKLTPAEWQRWLEPVGGETAEVTFEERSSTPIAQLQGMLQLRCPWPPDGVFHFTPVDSKIVTLLFWNGTLGTALVYHPQAMCDWAVYRLERLADSRRPKSISLAAIAKGGQPHAADPGFEIRQQGTQLIVSCGGTRLLAAPFTGPPQSVYILGDSRFRTFGMDRRIAPPETHSAHEANVLTFESPPDPEWMALPNATDRHELSARFEKLALQSADRGDSRAFEKHSERLFTLPIWMNQPIEPLPISLELAELVPLVDADRSDEVARICRSLRFWNQPADPAAPWPEDRLAMKRLVEWAEQTSRAVISRRPAPAPASESSPATPRHPWTVELGRDALSPALGLATAIADSSLDDACRFITETPLPADTGLVPDSRDVHLTVSWPQTIRNALHDEPRLSAAMQSGFGRLGELRLSRAVAEGDAEAVRTATIQFLGTQIVAEADLELGDRELALGRFTQALARFQAGLRDASPEQADRLEQRQRLAASFIGMEIGPPARASVSLNDTILTAEQFESLLETQRRRATDGKLLPTDQLTTRSTVGPPPGRYVLQPVVSWEVGPSPQDPAPKIARDIVHLAARGTESIYVTGGLGTIAMALQEQSIRWSHPRGLDQLARPNSEHMASAGDRLFWSRPTADGLELTCLDPLTGAVLWHKPRSDLPIISDPVWSQRQLFVVTAHSPAEGARRIALCELNPQKGDTVLQTDIGGLVDEEPVEPNCSLAAIDDRLILAAAGGVLCCDREGHVHWRQRSTWLPAEIRSLANNANSATALVMEPHAALVVLQPGAPGLQAFDLETGRRVWQHAIPDLNRIVGSVAGRIIAQTPRGVLAFQAADGAFVWQRELPASTCVCGVCNDGQVITGLVEGDENGKQQIVFQWLAGRDGRDESTTSVELTEPHINSVACFGSIAGRFVVVGCDTEKSAARLLELVPAGIATDKP